MFCIYIYRLLYHIQYLHVLQSPIQLFWPGRVMNIVSRLQQLALAWKNARFCDVKWIVTQTLDHLFTSEAWSVATGPRLLRLSCGTGARPGQRIENRGRCIGAGSDSGPQGAPILWWATCHSHCRALRASSEPFEKLEVVIPSLRTDSKLQDNWNPGKCHIQWAQLAKDIQRQIVLPA